RHRRSDAAGPRGWPRHARDGGHRLHRRVRRQDRLLPLSRRRDRARSRRLSRHRRVRPLHPAPLRSGRRRRYRSLARRSRIVSAAFTIAVGILLIVGAAFTLVAALGLLRFPDVYTRMHAASKVGTLGSGLVVIGLAVHAADFSVVMRAAAAILFFLLTAPL